MLLVENLEVVYNEVISAVKGISIKLPIGDIIAILGPNGSGKTSILRAIAGILKSQEGEITGGTVSLDGNQINGFPPEKVASLGIHLIPEGGGLFDDLTVLEHLRLAHSFSKAAKGKIGDKSFEKVWDWFPRLKERAMIKAGYLSGGEQQILALSMVLIIKPRILLMDEPSIGLAPVIVKELFSFLQRLNADEKMTVLLVEQNAFMALDVAKHGYILENGIIVLDGPSADLLVDKQVQEYYLGVGDKGSRRSYKDVKHYKTKKRWLSS